MGATRISVNVMSLSAVTSEAPVVGVPNTAMAGVSLSQM
jgi:hypothetical protein